MLIFRSDVKANSDQVIQDGTESLQVSEILLKNDALTYLSSLEFQDNYSQTEDSFVKNNNQMTKKIFKRPLQRVGMDLQYT